MGKMKSLYMGIYEDLCLEVLSMSAIARKHEVPFSWVQEVWDDICLQEGLKEPPAEETC